MSKVILLVDDSDTDRRIYRRYLSALGKGWSVEEAGSLQSALAKLATLRPACVLLDFRLPDSVGLEALKSLRKATAAPIIFMSGDPVPSLVSEAFGAGAVTYLSKDLLNQESMVSVVRAACAGREG